MQSPCKKDFAYNWFLFFMHFGWAIAAATAIGCASTPDTFIFSMSMAMFTGWTVRASTAIAC